MGVTLCAGLMNAIACSDSTDADAATETNFRMVPPPAAAGSGGTAGIGSSAPPAPPPADMAPPANPATPVAPSPADPAMATDTQTPVAPSTPADPATPPAESFPGESCDGCVRFFLPMTGENQRGDFELSLAAPVNMTGATLRFRLMTNAFAGNAGGVSVYVRDADNWDKGFVWTNLSALGTWTEVAVDFTATLTGNVSFDITRVAKVGVQLNSAGPFAGVNWQPATLYLDAVRFSNDPSADLTFSDGIGGFSLVSADAPEGTSVGFVAP